MLVDRCGPFPVGPVGAVGGEVRPEDGVEHVPGQVTAKVFSSPTSSEKSSASRVSAQPFEGVVGTLHVRGVVLLGWSSRISLVMAGSSAP